jgi:hypothetical protein
MQGANHGDAKEASSNRGETTAQSVQPSLAVAKKKMR